MFMYLKTVLIIQKFEFGNDKILNVFKIFGKKKKKKYENKDHLRHVMYQGYKGNVNDRNGLVDMTLDLVRKQTEEGIRRRQVGGSGDCVLRSGSSFHILKTNNSKANAV